MAKIGFLGFFCVCAVWAASPDGARFTESGELIRPADYREWIYLTSGIGMTYGAVTEAASKQPPRFDNVFVNPSSYRAFLQTGKWPDKTIFILEIRDAQTNGSINKGGHFQTGAVAVEAAVKDTQRFQGEWGYFGFAPDGPGAFKPSAKQLPTTARCYSCHSEHGAVENTFTQFYPTLFEVAKRLGTVKPGYKP